MADLAARLLHAHEARDTPALARLYRQAAQQAQGEARAFFLTHAFVFALEAGSPEAPQIETDLSAMGRH